jgi:outer membrane receptor protein involved in Fe transport
MDRGAVGKSNFGTAAAWCMVSLILTSGSVLAQTAAPAAGGSTATEAPPALGTTLSEVTVSASAITIAGYDQPTPVSSIGLQQLQSAAQPDLSDAVRTLPVFGGSSSPQNSVITDYVSNGAAALDQIDLRGLGPNRTLLLIDGQRIVDGSRYGGAETSNIPSNLVQRVDVVTGGASAIWGSNAVAGVVNYVLNHNFNGVQIDFETSNNNQSEHQQNRLDLTAGTGFADDRGHIEASLSEWRVPHVYFIAQSEGYQGQWLVNNPACNLASGTPDPFTGLICPPGKPPLVHGTNIGVYSATPGGLVNGCADAMGNYFYCGLTNTYFVGPNATPMPFDNGNISNYFITNGGTPNTVVDEGGVKGVPQKTDTAFLLGSFKFNDHVEATLQGNFGYTTFMMTVDPVIQYGSATIYSGNPFIPAATQAEMNAEGASALYMGTTNTNPFTGMAPNLPAMAQSVGNVVLQEDRRLMRGVAGLDGDFGGNWTWNAYYERSETHQNENVFNNPLKASLANAEDAVRVGSYSAHYTAAGYPNPLGLPTGTVTCLSNLLPIGAAGETSNCAPLNIFGTGPGVASPEAMNYVNAVARSGGNSDHTNITENVGAANIQGKLPFGTHAGPIAMAAGLLYRNETGITVNCGYYCDTVAFRSGNFTNFYGHYSVKEASIEFNAPLLKDQGVKDLSVDAAYRAVDYSTSGFVSTYKFGVVSQLTDIVRLRASYSLDIRAGNLNELFESPSTIGTPAVDPRTGNTLQIYQIEEGNPKLLPEKGETRTAGFVFTPIQGFTTSIDWYYIRIKDVIGSIPTSQVANLCKQGNATFCEYLTFGTYPGGCSGPTLNSCPAGLPLAAIATPAVNSDSQTTTGLDFLADYRMPFMGGSLDFNVDTNYIFSFDYTHLGTTCDALNGLSYDQANYPSCVAGQNVKFRGTVAVSYAQGGWLGTVQTRMIGAAHLVNVWTSGVNVDNNDIPFYAYLDLRLSYRFGNGIQLYGAVDNVADRIQPSVLYSPYSYGDLYEAPYRDDIYDGFGRVWRLGIRAHF